MKTTANTIIGSAGFVVVQHNHIALLQNKTTFGVVINDNVKNIIQEKIAFRGLITDLWDGQKRAPGYLVFDNKIIFLLQRLLYHVYIAAIRIYPFLLLFAKSGVIC